MIGHSVQSTVFRSSSGKVSPFGYRRIIGCSAPPRRFSQPATSFFGIFSQGIHHVRVVVSGEPRRIAAQFSYSSVLRLHLHRAGYHCHRSKLSRCLLSGTRCAKSDVEQSTTVETKNPPEADDATQRTCAHLRLSLPQIMEWGTHYRPHYTMVDVALSRGARVASRTRAAIGPG